MDLNLSSHRINVLQSVFALGVMVIITTFEANVDGLRNTIRGSNYEIHTLRIQCPFSTEFISNVTCYSKRLNRTSEQFALEIYGNPGVQVDNIVVSTIHVYLYVNLQVYISFFLYVVLKVQADNVQKDDK